MPTKRFSFEPKASGDNAVEVSIFYRKTGMNWYNGHHERGGFYISFTIGKETMERGYSSFSHMMFEGGFKYMIEEASRDNKKKIQALFDKVADETVAKLAFDGDKQAAVEYVRNKLK